MTTRSQREHAVANALAKEFLRVAPSLQGFPPTLLAHHYGLVCERLGFMPDDASTGRILNYVLKQVTRLNRKLAKVVR